MSEAGWILSVNDISSAVCTDVQGMGEENIDLAGIAGTKAAYGTQGSLALDIGGVLFSGIERNKCLIMGSSCPLQSYARWPGLHAQIHGRSNARQAVCTLI